MTTLNTIIEDEKNKAIAITVRLENEVFHGRFSSSTLECIEKIIAEELTTAMQRAYEQALEDVVQRATLMENPIVANGESIDGSYYFLYRGHLDQLKKEIN